MASVIGHSSFGNGIVAVEMELTSGTWYTLWAPNWTVRGESWQAFLGDDQKIFVFDSPAKLLAHLDNGGRNELEDHPQWHRFAEDLAGNVQPASKAKISFIELPRQLAKRPGYESTNAVTLAFELLRSIGSVAGVASINNWFHSYSILANTRRGADHYASSAGLEEWSGVGRTVLDRWTGILDDIDEVITAPEVDEDLVSDAEKRVTEAASARETARKEVDKNITKKSANDAVSQDSKESQDTADPYDDTRWAAAGIDPIRISINGQYVYTLRCYLDDKPLFLGNNGRIHTFPNSKALVRWIIDAKEHDLEDLETWGSLVTAANSGELEVTVHDSNQYAFAGLREDIASSVDAVDTDQLGRAYELLADAADWAGDDGVNQVLLAYPKLQNYLAYMLGAPNSSIPTAPFDNEAKGWLALEEGLIKRFTKF